MQQRRFYAQRAKTINAPGHTSFVTERWHFARIYSEGQEAPPLRCCGMKRAPGRLEKVASR